MIYRIIGETERYRWAKDDDGYDVVKRETGTLAGAMIAGFGTFGDLKAPPVRNHRARFWFTEAGWEKYGRDVMADAMRSGRVYRLLRRKNPPGSAVVYRDKWQVAVLPLGKKKK